MANVDSEKQHLVGSSSGSEFYPVDRVVVRQQYRRVGVGVAIACCLGLGLSLAIALPLANRGNGSAGGDGQQVQKKAMLMSAAGPQGMLMKVKDVAAVTEESVRRQETTDPSSTEFNSMTVTWPFANFTWPWWNHRTTTQTPFTRPWWPRRTTTQTPVSTSDSSEQTTETSTSISTTTAAWLPRRCPRLPPRTRSRVDLDDVVSTSIWYEMIRVQTYNTPAYVDYVSCSTMQMTSMQSPADAEALLAWEEGGLFRRKRSSVTLYLHRNDTESPDWIEKVGNPNVTEFNQYSFLARIDGFLLIYECFPQVRWPTSPGYVIRVYSSEPRLDYSGERIAELMVTIADMWGLNPEETTPIRIRQRFCNTNVGYA